MSRLVFDLETNGLMPDVSTLHVCCTYDLDTKEEWYSTDQDEIISHLSSATHLICHNLIDYDLPVLEKLTGWKPNDTTKITDTLVLSRLGNPDRTRPSQMARDGVKAGPHSLAAWGYRVGVGKPEHEDWSVYSDDMLHRCRRDVRINTLMYDIVLEETKDFGESVQLEHEVQRIMSKQERDGVYFDKEKAEGYITDLKLRVEGIDEQLLPLLPKHARQVGVSVRKPFKKDGTLTKAVLAWYIVDPLDDPGYDQVSYYSNLIGGPFSRIEWYQTDLNSVKQVKEWLLSIGWKPLEWNTSLTTGARTSPKLTEDSFDSIQGGSGPLLKARVTWRHRRSQIQGWIDKCREDHCLPAGANPLGTNTGRMRHRVVVNVPSAKPSVLFGTEMRSLFCARPNRKFIGHDASGLELRMLAHYMNDNDFTEQILNGDIHTYNQRLAGLSTRDLAKVFIYALIYGAGDAKLGRIIGGSKAEGAKLRNRFLSALPKLGELIDKVKAASKKGYLIGLDGRKIFMRRQDDGSVMQHKALNTLLQCAGAVVMKKSLTILTQSTKDLDVIKVIDMHDEGQADVSPEDAEEYCVLAEESIREAGRYFNLNIPLDAEAKQGLSWADTH